MLESESIIARWLTYVQQTNSPRTAVFYRITMERLKPWMPEDLSEFTEKNVQNFLDAMLDQGLKPNSIAAYYYGIRSMCEWAGDRYDLPNPCDKIRAKMFKRGKPKQRILSPQEYQLCLLKSRGRQRDIFQFLGNTGLRCLEFCSVTWKDVFPNAILVRGKGDKDRQVPLNSIARRVLASYERTGEHPAFVTRNHGELYYLCEKLSKQLDIPQFGPHAIRHYFATELFRHNVPLKKISMILGHASTAVTESIYVHARQEDILGVTDCLAC